MQNHPLFPPLDGEDESPEVTSIHVTRYHDGQQKWCGYKFGPDELTELQQVQEIFGGGMYELVARGENGNGWSARRRYSLDGRSKPLVYGTASDPEPQPQGFAQSHPAQPAQGADQGTLGIIMTMQQSTNQMFLQMMTMQNNMLTALLTRDGDGNKTMVQAMAENNRAALQGQAQVFQAMIEAKSGGKGASVSDLKEAMEFGAELASKSNDGDDNDGLLDTVSKVAEAVAAVNGGGAANAAETAAAQ
jgi:hypothetical protein